MVAAVLLDAVKLTMSKALLTWILSEIWPW